MKDLITLFFFIFLVLAHSPILLFCFFATSLPFCVEQVFSLSCLHQC